mgnify:CR=1 FL=1
MNNYTFISADWENDKDAVDMLRSWNNDPNNPVKFHDVHNITQARDTSLNCSIKESLRQRMSMCKRLVLVVGQNTSSLRSGYCSYCNSYNRHTQSCARGYSVDNRSYIEYECELALYHNIEIMAIYNSYTCNSELLPLSLLFEWGIIELPLYRLPFQGAEKFPFTWEHNWQQISQYLHD